MVETFETPTIVAKEYIERGEHRLATVLRRPPPSHFQSLGAQKPSCLCKRGKERSPPSSVSDNHRAELQVPRTTSVLPAFISPPRDYWYRRRLRFGTFWMGCEIAILDQQAGRVQDCFIFVPRPFR